MSKSVKEIMAEAQARTPWRVELAVVPIDTNFDGANYLEIMKDEQAKMTIDVRIRTKDEAKEAALMKATQLLRSQDYKAIVLNARELREWEG